MHGIYHYFDINFTLRLASTYSHVSTLYGYYCTCSRFGYALLRNHCAPPTRINAARLAPGATARAEWHRKS